jgi:hypothetical protein
MGTQGGFGVKLEIEVGSTLTAVAHILEMDYPEFEKVLYERTGHDSPGGYVEHGASGKRKVSDFKVKLEWDKEEATHTAMLAAFDSDDPVGMSVADPDSTETIAFDAHVQKVGRIAEQEQGYYCEVTIQPTGKPTIS